MDVSIDEDLALKQRHRAMWASGDYPSIAVDLIADLGRDLVRACAIEAGQRVLDVAAGTGNAAIPAAMTGAKVTASDLTPELLEAGKPVAAERGATLSWVQADAEDLPFGDGEFDVVMSCIGVMFAPHHRSSADEMLRVCRPGGRIGLLCWTPQGFLGQMLATMKPYAAPPPPGAQPPTLWGDPSHLDTLFGDRVTDVRAERRLLRVDRFCDAVEFRDYFKQRYGPTIAAYRNVADDPERIVAMDRDLAELARQHGADDGGMDWEYLLFTARKSPDRAVEMSD